MSAVNVAKVAPGKVALALFGVYVLWGSTYLAIRIGVETLPPLLMAGVRFIVAGSAMYLWLRWRGAPRLTRREWGAAAGTGVLLLAVGNGALAAAEQTVASGLAAVMVASVPLFVAVFAGVGGEWPGRREWLGLALGTAGVVLLNLESDMRASPAGALLLLLSPAAWALGSVWSRTAPLPKGALASAAQMLMGGAVLVVAGLAFGERFPAHPSTRSLLAVVYLMVFGSILGFTAYGFLIRTVRPALATSYAYVNPALAVLLGVALVGERVSAFGLVGMLVILGGVALVATRRPTARPSQRALQIELAAEVDAEQRRERAGGVGVVAQARVIAQAGEGGEVP